MTGRTKRSGLVVFCLLLQVVLVRPAAADEHAITYVGVFRDVTNFRRLGIGHEGFWFPQFDATDPVTERPTGENARDQLPEWAGPLNHATTSDPTYLTRSFSQDGPARSKGGQPGWNIFTLPGGGDVGRSGAIVDPFTASNSNNTINRIQLSDGVPATFYFHVVTDNTAGQHDPVNRLRARGKQAGIDVPIDVFPRGELNGVDIDPDRSPERGELAFNGIADIYTFRYVGFVPNDFIKLQLNGGDGGASFGGLLFDVAPFSLNDADGDKILDGSDLCPTKPSDSVTGCPKHKPKKKRR